MHSTCAALAVVTTLLVPVNCSRSRRSSSKVVRTSVVIVRCAPFTVKLMVVFTGTSVACIVFSPPVEKLIAETGKERHRTRSLSRILPQIHVGSISHVASLPDGLDRADDKTRSL